MQDPVEVLLRALVLAEVVGAPACRHRAGRRSPCCPLRLPGRGPRRCGGARAGSSRPWTCRPARPASMARTGVCSRRLDVSAALRMSTSPMLRTASACAEKVGEFSWAEFSAVRKSLTLESSTGTWAGLDLRGHGRCLGRGDRCRRRGRGEVQHVGRRELDGLPLGRLRGCAHQMTSRSWALAPNLAAPTHGGARCREGLMPCSGVGRGQPRERLPHGGPHRSGRVRRLPAGRRPDGCLLRVVA